ncbi:MAG TPA: VWA domain-containing protein, partial [Gaiellaceae bacterium]|nr:VWA domain-containing protein [Gaiellaceae bacterium]
MRRQGIPLFDVRNLTEPVRRTAVVRLVLGAALVVTLLAAAWLSRDPGASAVRIASGGESGVIVLDMSASIGSARKRITEPFEYLADTNQDFGLVLFSSVAYEAMPPGTAAPELRAFLRVFDPHPNVCVAREFTPCPPGQRRIEPDSPEFNQLQNDSATPWAENFRGGTKISTGLVLARQLLERHDMKERGTLLISDLD